MDKSEIKIGIPAQITPPVDRNFEITRKLDEYGYNSMWYPDHLMGWIPDSIWTPDLMPIAKFQETPHVYLETFSLIAAHSVLTKNINMGIAVTETLRRHPAQIAQILLSLDQISKGRLIVGIGAGEAENTIPYGIDYSRPVSKFEENLRIIKLFMDNPNTKLDFDGEFWQLKDAIIGIEPHEKNKPPPLWIGAHGPRMLRITGELADGWIPIGMPLEDYKKKLNTIRNHTKKFDRTPNDITPAIYFYTVLANNEEECQKIMTSPLGRAWVLTAFDLFYKSEGCRHPLCDILNKESVNPLTDFIPIRLNREDALQAINAIPLKVIEKFFFHGNQETVIKAIEDYAKVGCQHFVFWNFTGMIDPSKYSESNKILLNVLKYFKD
ncbi:MAG: LLM class flavin-dependent oxidoreductase [Promethearchaeota archaeon]|nr:MAG: LLM class flavin-dependent oxidoreductase [Candidatus Lokiarchaeota archaeon]